MPDTSTEPELLLTCVQDLHAGCAAFRERFPAIARRAQDGEVQAELRLLVEHAAERAARLELMDGAQEGPVNLWMAGILDDARRDTQTIAAGLLLDTALIGAVRKAIVAELVSHETAIGLARKLGEDEVLRALRNNRTQLSQIDDTLAGLLETETSPRFRPDIGQGPELPAKRSSFARIANEGASHGQACNRDRCIERYRP